LKKDAAALRVAVARGVVQGRLLAAVQGLGAARKRRKERL
jgi:hypothetical protein